MASVGTLTLLYSVMIPAIGAGVSYVGYKAATTDLRKALITFVTGPGRTSRILLLVFFLTNWKSTPLSWTVCSNPLCLPFPPRGEVPFVIHHYSSQKLD